MKNLVVSGVTALVGASSFSIFAEEAKDNPEVDPKAKEIIERAVDYLVEAKQFRVSAEIWQDLEVEPGVKGQFSKVVEIQLRRPDRLRLDVSTSVPKRSFYYNGIRSRCSIARRGSSHPPRLRLPSTKP